MFGHFRDQIQSVSVLPGGTGDLPSLEVHYVSFERSREPPEPAAAEWSPSLPFPSVFALHYPDPSNQLSSLMKQ